MPKRGSRRDLLALAWIVALILLALSLSARAQASWSDKRIDGIASWLAGRPVSVNCLTLEESKSDFTIRMGAAAYVDGWFDAKNRWHPYDAAVFDHGICERLRDVLDGDASRWSGRSLAWAVLVLTHESGHLMDRRWSRDEAKTECWAVQHVQAVGRRLGITALPLLQYLVNEQHRMLREQYQLPGCVIPGATP